jgi:hypothetical protein
MTMSEAIVNIAEQFIRKCEAEAGVQINGGLSEVLEGLLINAYERGRQANFPTDGTCARCGAVPRNSNGLCATCVDEDNEKQLGSRDPLEIVAEISAAIRARATKEPT